MKRISKEYTDTCYNDLVSCLYRNVEGGNCIYSLLRSVDRAEEKYPGIKRYFIHDMNAWLTSWFELISDTAGCSLKLRLKILSVAFSTDNSSFNNINIYCTTIATDINPELGISYGEDLAGYIACAVKAIVQTKRRSLGLDCNSKKYGEQLKSKVSA